MSNMRKEVRKKLIAFTPVYYAAPRTLLGYIADLTMNGAMIMGEKPADAGKETKITIEFPNNLPDLPVSKITIPSRIAWNRHDETPAYFNIGVEFIELDEKSKEIIRAVLERYQFSNAMPDANFNVKQ